MFGQDNGDEESGRRVLQISTNERSVVWHRMEEQDLFSPSWPAGQDLGAHRGHL